MKEAKIQDSLFRSGATHGNAVLNFTRVPMREFTPIAESYHKAANLLVTELESAHGYSDMDAYPIIFLYRHSVELYLKAIAHAGKDILSLKNKSLCVGERVLLEHSLTAMLPAIRQIFEEMGWNWNKSGVAWLSSYEDVLRLLQELDAVDSHSYTFRYPVNKKGKAPLPHHFVINVPELARKMDGLLDLMDNIATGLEYTWEEMAEAAYELQKVGW